MENRNFVYQLAPEDMEPLRQLLERHNWEIGEAPYMVFRARKEKTSVGAYVSGKLVIQGKGASDFVEFLLEPEFLKEKIFENPVPEADTAGPFVPHAGMDESGKGDFFGPLVVAAVYVPDEAAALELLKYGVKDSKQIKND